MNWFLSGLLVLLFCSFISAKYVPSPIAYAPPKLADISPQQMYIYPPTIVVVYIGGVEWRRFSQRQFSLDTNCVCMVE